MNLRASGRAFLTGLLAAAWLTPVLAVGAIGLGASPTIAVIAAILLAFAGGTWLVRLLQSSELPIASASSRAWFIAPAFAGMLAIVWIARLAIFMADPTRVECSFTPADRFRTEHSCFSAYAEALRFAQAGDRNIYDAASYQPTVAGRLRPRYIGALKVDVYHYPPPFLLLPAALRTLAPDFLSLRACWFMAQALLFAAAGLILARWIGGAPGAWTLSAWWLLLASPPFLQTLQQGNIQITVLPLAMIGLASVAGDRVGRSWMFAGSTLLAYASLAKIFPGVLGLFLVMGRRWRIVTWMAVASLLLTAVTFAIFGWRPFGDFLGYELPRIATGEAFPQAERPDPMAVNLSIYGLIVRLRTLGLAWLTPDVTRMIASAYGLFVLLLAAAAGWRHAGAAAPDSPTARLAFARLALALLTLAAFRSPFVGVVYGYVPTLWMLTLLAADASGRARVAWLLTFAAVTAAVVLTPSPIVGVMPPRFVIAWTGAVFMGVLLLNVAVVLRALAPAPVPAPRQEAYTMAS